MLWGGGEEQEELEARHLRGTVQRNCKRTVDEGCVWLNAAV